MSVFVYLWNKVFFDCKKYVSMNLQQQVAGIEILSVEYLLEASLIEYT